ncbi:DedD protein [hydrothermal vent metagenome]|uniref:DedD protein n=1 Tax=hydrothermal vent metagenome TaxID=652676 RepID=A0A3B1BUV4_9ZZZZ
MEQHSRLKQRLVGAIVLVALGVIFIPMVLDGERESGFIVNGSSIPAKPAEIKNIRQFEFANDNSPAAGRQDAGQEKIRIPVDEHSAPLSTAIKAPAAVNRVRSSKLKTDRHEQSASPVVVQKRKVPVAPTSQAWAVQVGSFKQRSNAFKLRDRLRKQKYKVFVEGIRSNNAKFIYRVRLGPYVNRVGAERVRERLLSRQKIKGLLVRHP